MVNWVDFESVIEVCQITKIACNALQFNFRQQSIVSKDDAAKNARLKVLRKRLEQHFQKYFWDLLKVGDTNDEWLNVMNDIVNDLKKTNEFPDWFEGLFKALWRANEFLGNYEFCSLSL